MNQFDTYYLYYLCMKINLLFHSLSITKVISAGCLLILFFSGIHFITVLSILNTQEDNNASIVRLINLKHSTNAILLNNQNNVNDLTDTVSPLVALTEVEPVESLLFDVSKLNSSNRNLNDAFVKLQENINEGPYNKSSYQLMHLTNLITLSINQYQSLLNKQLYLVKVSEVITFILLTICSFLLLMYCKRHIVKPIKTLEDNVASLSKHDFDVKYPKYSNEMGTLSDGMRSMSSELEQLIKVMQHKVFEKTKELEKANETIQFLYKISQQLSTVELTTPIIVDALNALGKQAKLSQLCLQYVNGTQINSQYGSATLHKEKKRIPIIINGKPFGYLNYVMSEEATATSASVITSFSSLLARALYQEEYSLQEQKFLLMEERGVIARELHDSIAQALSFLKIQCAVLHRQIESKNNEKEAKESVNNIQEAVSDAYIQLRSLLSTFRLNISVSDFKEAVLVLISQLQKQTTIKIKLGNFESNFQTHANQHIHLLQIIREAATNAIKHAKCNTITINCVQVDDKVSISIADDGIGISETPGKVNHYGLEIMNQRASELNAKLTIKNLSVGTEVKLTFSI